MRNRTDRMMTDGKRQRPAMAEPRPAPALGTQAAHDMGCWCDGDKDGELCKDCPLRRRTGNPIDRTRAQTK